jgi:hypothetical protein
MYVVGVGPVTSHAAVNMDGASFTREVIPNVAAGDGTVTIAGELTCGGTAVSGETLPTGVSNLGRVETSEAVYKLVLSETKTVTISSCGGAALFDSTLSVYTLPDGTDISAGTVDASAAGSTISGGYNDGIGSTCGTRAMITGLNLPAGTHLVVIDGWPNGNADHRHGQYSLQVTCAGGSAGGRRLQTTSEFTAAELTCPSQVACHCADTDNNDVNGAEDCKYGVVAADGTLKDQGTTDWCLAGMLAVTEGSCEREIGTKRFGQHACTQAECCVPAPAGSVSAVVTIDTEYATLGDPWSAGVSEFHTPTLLQQTRQHYFGSRPSL